MNVTTFAGNDEVLLTLNTRPGADVGQVIIGFTACQALELIRRLSVHSDLMQDAVAAGKGGAAFPEGL